MQNGGHNIPRDDEWGEDDPPAQDVPGNWDLRSSLIWWFGLWSIILWNYTPGLAVVLLFMVAVLVFFPEASEEWEERLCDWLGWWGFLDLNTQTKLQICTRCEKTKFSNFVFSKVLKSDTQVWIKSTRLSDCLVKKSRKKTQKTLVEWSEKWSWSWRCEIDIFCKEKGKFRQIKFWKALLVYSHARKNLFWSIQKNVSQSKIERCFVHNFVFRRF